MQEAYNSVSRDGVRGGLGLSGPTASTLNPSSQTQTGSLPLHGKFKDSLDYVGQEGVGIEWTVPLKSSSRHQQVTGLTYRG